MSPVWIILSAISTSPVNDPVPQSIFGVPVNPPAVPEVLPVTSPVRLPSNVTAVIIPVWPA